MFSQFDFSGYDKKCIVKVVLNKEINGDEDFNDFLDKWRELYNLQKDFIFIFDTSNVGYIPLKYSIKMSFFIKNLKRERYQYLQKSIIYVNKNIVKRMLDFIFMIQPPVAPVYIIDNKDYIDDILNNIINENVIIVLPGKSFLNLF